MPDAVRTDRRALVAGLALPVVTAVAVGVTMVSQGAGLDRRYLAVSWQLVDLPVLRDDPLGSVWNLHTQPPLFNLVVGAVLRWSPTPPIGTLFVLYVGCLAVTGLVLADLLRRWRVPAVAAGAIAAVALVVTGPLVTVAGGSYEVPVAALLAVALWLAHRHLEAPTTGRLIALSATLTAVVMTRSLFHPAWLLAALALVLVARPVTRGPALAALAIPLVVIGGWMVKNEAVVGEATLSSWVGFNLQRGVTATFDRSVVEEAVADDAVTPLALEHPFQSLDAYPEADGCRTVDRHPALETRPKSDLPFEVANFNDPCYLPLYEESRANASALLRREPGQYLARRDEALLFTFRTNPLGYEDPGGTLAGPDQPSRTWMDAVSGVVLVPVTATVSSDGWNLPIQTLSGDDFDVALGLAVGFLAVVGRGLWALGRLLRAGWRERATAWPAAEVTWVLVASIVGMAVVVSGLVELGENDRFRATVDPFLVALPLGLVARAVAARGPGRGASTSADGSTGAGPGDVPTDDVDAAPETRTAVAP